MDVSEVQRLWIHTHLDVITVRRIKANPFIISISVRGLLFVYPFNVPAVLKYMFTYLGE